MVDFYIASNLDEAKACLDCLSFPEKLHAYLYDEFRFDSEAIELVGLSFYCDETVIDKDKIFTYLKLAERFKNYHGEREKEIKKFFCKFKNLCEKALIEDKTIIAIGD